MAAPIDLDRVALDPDHVAAVFGTRPAFGFPCPIPGHRGMAAIGGRTGAVVFECDCTGGTKRRPIGAAFAATHYGGMQWKPSDVEVMLWTLRLGWESEGRPELPRVELPALPESAPVDARTARDWRVVQLGLAAHMDALAGGPVPYAREFVRAWCGFRTNYKARTAIEYLRSPAVRVLVEVDRETGLVVEPRRGRYTRYYVPGAPLLARGSTRGTREAVAA
jgi:hypothetical protein